MTDDRTFLDAAVALASEALADDDGGPFGAVVVQGDRIVGRGRNRVLATADPTAHAEVLAIRDAGTTLGTHELDDCVIYSSSEPCPMCLAAVYWAGIRRLVFANDRRVAADIGFADDALYAELAAPTAGRSITTEHVPFEDAESVMRQWAARPGRILY